MANSRNERRKRNKPVAVREDPYDIQHIHAQDVVVGMKLRYDGVVETVAKVDYNPEWHAYIVSTEADTWLPVARYYLFLMVYDAAHPTEAERRAVEKVKAFNREQHQARNSNA